MDASANIATELPDAYQTSSSERQLQQEFRSVLSSDMRRSLNRSKLVRESRSKTLCRPDQISTFFGLLFSSSFSPPIHAPIADVAAQAGHSPNNLFDEYHPYHHQHHIYTQPHTSSRFKGVTRHRRSRRWEAHCWSPVRKKQIYLGGFEEEEKAAEVLY